MMNVRMLTYNCMEPIALFLRLLEQTREELLPHTGTTEILVHIQ